MVDKRPFRPNVKKQEVYVIIVMSRFLVSDIFSREIRNFNNRIR